jgi:hypothetical protein
MLLVSYRHSHQLDPRVRQRHKHNALQLVKIEQIYIMNYFSSIRVEAGSTMLVPQRESRDGVQIPSVYNSEDVHRKENGVLMNAYLNDSSGMFAPPDRYPCLEMWGVRGERIFSFHVCAPSCEKVTRFFSVCSNNVNMGNMGKRWHQIKLCKKL